MGLGGRWLFQVVLLLGVLFAAFEARAGDGGPLLVFDASAESLPQAEIRAAVEKELGKPLAASAETASSELSVAIDAERRLVVRHRSARGTVERVLPMPTEPSDVPLIISLAAGNLARDQSDAVPRPKPVEEVPTTLAEEKPAPKAAAPRDDATARSPAAPSPPRFERHRMGLHLAQDLALVGGSNVCDPNLGQKSDNYACFYEGTADQPFYHTPYPYEDGIDTHVAFATTRVLFSYDYAIVPSLSVGGRIGYAFGGGPPAGQEPVDPIPFNNLNLLRAHARGTNGHAFAPVHVEFRGQFWFLPLGKKRLSAYVGAGFGYAQVDSKTTVAERDCALTLPQNNPDWNAAADGTFDDCMRGKSSFNWKKLPTTRVDAWKKMGKGFAALSFGMLLPTADVGGVLLNVNAMYMLPAAGIVLEPSLGFVAAL